MLTDDEYDELDRVVFSSITAFTSLLGLAGVPAAAQLIVNLSAGVDAPVALGSKVADAHGQHLTLRVPPMLWDMAQAGEKVNKIPHAVALITSGLLGSAYEIMDELHRSNDRDWQFLRHARNACFHSNKFHFYAHVIDAATGQLRHPATWRGLTIEPALQGQPLMYDFLAPGDAFLLLADITARIGLPAGKPPLFAPADPAWVI